MRASLMAVLIMMAVVFPVLGNEVSRYAIESEILGEEREYLVRLPTSYDDPSIGPAAYPVVILLDGDAYMPTMAGIVHFMASDAVYTFMIPEVIVVGVPHADRTRELTPVRGEKAVDDSPLTHPDRTGGGEEFLRFVGEELLPAVEGRWRTVPYRVLVGHSTGGLLALWDATSDEPVAQAHLAIDPSAWWADGAVLARISGMGVSEDSTRRVYLAEAGTPSISGINSSAHGGAIQRAARLMQASQAFDLHHQVFEDDAHDTVALPAFHRGLASVFSGYRPDFGGFYAHPERIEAHYEAFSERLGVSMPPPEGLLHLLADWAEGDGRIEAALSFRRLAVVHHPDSWPAVAALVDGLEAGSSDDEALEILSGFLDAHPEKAEVRRRFEELSAAQGVVDED